MVFSSTIFFFCFLPVTLVGYFLLPSKAKNIFLLIVSLVFYAWGEPRFIFVMILIIILNYLLAMMAEVARTEENRKKRKFVIILTVVSNLSIFFVYKYMNFTIANINALFGKTLIPQTEIALPIGISFLTFQAMSYVFDVLNGDGRLQHNPLNVGLYVSLFPQLIAGPIVRYRTVAEEINKRKTTLNDFAEGVYRFIFGMGKKVLIANSVAQIADQAFECGSAERSPIMAWMGVIAYALQIYYDFSGYSDMAIGLGKMLGFHFLENFNYPYISKTITEFWRRWHISLGTWFRDYVYIPLGGSRLGNKRTIFNLLVVWLLTGVWHGANWTFIAWGMLFFFVLVIEKLLNIPFIVQKSKHSWPYRIITLLIILFGWVLFRANTIREAWAYFQTMFSFSRGYTVVDSFWIAQYGIILTVGIVISLPIVPTLKDMLLHVFPTKGAVFAEGFRIIALIAVGVLSVMCIVSSTYNPFIYFNF